MLLVNDCAKVRNKYYKVRISSKKMLELFFFGVLYVLCPDYY